MTDRPIVFDSVRFWDLASETYISTGGNITDPSMIPVRGDFVRLGDSEKEFLVMNRYFHFAGGICSVRVTVQPAAHDI